MRIFESPAPVRLALAWQSRTDHGPRPSRTAAGATNTSTQASNRSLDSDHAHTIPENILNGLGAWPNTTAWMIGAPKWGPVEEWSALQAAGSGIRRWRWHRVRLRWRGAIGTAKRLRPSAYARSGARPRPEHDLAKQRPPPRKATEKRLGESTSSPPRANKVHRAHTRIASISRFHGRPPQGGLLSANHAGP